MPTNEDPAPEVIDLTPIAEAFLSDPETAEKFQALPEADQMSLLITCWFHIQDMQAATVAVATVEFAEQLGLDEMITLDKEIEAAVFGGAA